MPAYENLDAILAVGSIDGIFIGPNDISTSLGKPDDYSDPRYIEVIGDIIRRSEKEGIPTMVHQQTIETSRQAINLGARFVLHAMDTNILQRALQNEFNQLREIAGESTASTNATVDIA